MEPIPTIYGEVRLKEQRGCSINGCDRHHHGAGFCQRHYYQQYKARWKAQYAEKQARLKAVNDG